MQTINRSELAEQDIGEAAAPPAQRLAACGITVLIVTYNHARWITAAVESALAQRTSRPVEILISEDASTDGTREIVGALAESYPGRIRLLLSDRNVRSNEVVARGIRAAAGRYLALLDGDDLWVDDTTLERQATILDADPDCVAVFFNALVAEEERVMGRRWTRASLPRRLTAEQLWMGNPYATCAGLIRTRALGVVPAWYAGFFPITDWPLYLLAARHGHIEFRDEVSGLYRLHSQGMHSPLSGAAKFDAIEGFYRRMIAVAGADFAVAARHGGTRFFLEWAEALAATEPRQAWNCLSRAMGLAGAGRILPKRRAARVVGRIFSQSLGRA